MRCILIGAWSAVDAIGSTVALGVTRDNSNDVAQRCWMLSGSSAPVPGYSARQWRAGDV